MAVEHADISTELQNIKSAVYGKDVRNSIYDAIRKMNTQLNTAIDTQLITLDDTFTDDQAGANSAAVGEAINELESSIDMLASNVPGIAFGRDAINIQQGSNLNNPFFSYFGVYVCTGAAIAASLINCPVSDNAFVMYVERVAGTSSGTSESNAYRQRIVPYHPESCDEWVRIYSSHHNTFGDWINHPKMLKNAIDLAELEISYYQDTGKCLLSRGDFRNCLYNPSINSINTEFPYRISAYKPMSFSYDITLTIASGFRIYPWYKLSNDTWEAKGFKTGTFTIPANQIFTIYIARVTENTSEIADPAEFLSKVTFDNNGLQSLVNEIIQSQIKIVTPQMFGAKANGTTDDTEAINLAIAAADIIVFPKARYKITSTISIPSFKTILGCGSNIVADGIVAFKIEGTSNSSLLYITFKDFICNGCSSFLSVYSANDINISGLNIVSTSYACLFEKVTRFTVSNIIITNTGSTTDGLHFNRGCNLGRISNIYGKTGDDFIALNARESEHGTSGGISNLVFDQCMNDNETYCSVRIYGSGSSQQINNIRFLNCRFYARQNEVETSAIRFTNGVSTAGDSSLSPSEFGNITFEDCDITTLGDTEAVTIAYCNIKNLIFNRCKFARSSYSAHNNFILITGTSNINKINIENCSFDNPSTNVVLGYVAHTVNINDFVFEKSSYNSCQSEVGILRIDGTTDRVRIIDSNFANVKKIVNINSNGIIREFYANNCYLDNAALLLLVSGQIERIVENNISSKNYTGTTFPSINQIASAQSNENNTCLIFSGVESHRAINVNFVSDISASNVRFKCGVISNETPSVGKAGDNYIKIDSNTGATSFMLSNGSSWNSIT